ncbi:MAG TPA: AmmeMemoRadiSam system protein A [Oscillospiraceae bacterium]|nr:AmmeMemoRadiSam system protein A [Oscillospiraceae bacterium]
MRTVVHAGIYPHPAIVIPAVGGSEAKLVAETAAAMSELAGRIKQSGADVLVLITPHGPMFRDAVALLADEQLTGSLAQFAAPEITFSWPNEKSVLQAIELEAERFGINCAHLDNRRSAAYGVEVTLDHGAMVPLYFLQQRGIRLPLVHITYGLLAAKQLYSFGQAVRKALLRLKRHAAVICSADLSHRLKEDAPAGYSPAGQEFDQKLIHLVERFDVEAILNLNHRLVEEAGECGYRSLIIALGILDGETVEPEILSYEGPFGVGYLVADLTPGRKRTLQPFASTRTQESEHVQLARHTLETFVRTKQVITPPTASSLCQQRAGAFVSLHLNGELRGCIGSIEAQQANLAAEIVENAISAGIYDPRFPPVTAKELSGLVYSVDVLAAAEAVDSMAELDPQQFGVIVEEGQRRGLLLPNLSGVETAEVQVSIALQKAGINPSELYQLYRFRVQRYY